MADRGGASWIWVPGFDDRDNEVPGRFVLFRKAVQLNNQPDRPCVVHISADTRYRLFVNDKSVAFGPCKSYPTRWYYETVDLAPFLVAGDNIITAKVLRFFPDQIGSTSLMRTNTPGLIMWGNIDGQPFQTDSSWSCRADRSIRLQPRSEWNYILGPPFLSLDETVDFSLAESKWQEKDTDITHWSNAIPAVPTVKMMPALEPWKLYPRPIPPIPEVTLSFKGAVRCCQSHSLQAWNDLLTKQKQVTIEPSQTTYVELESSVLTTGFVEFDFFGGKDAEITILYAESYEKDLGVDSSPFPRPRSKADRRGWQNGRLYGSKDVITLAAEPDTHTRYEPFWYRTFRFIRLSITCKSTPLVVSRIAYRETQYPLSLDTKLGGLRTNLQQVWDMCVNTLLKCMHETYEDCPFYEQNQFAMDGRLQLLFTYQLSNDDRLARKTIHEFYASRREDGLLETNYPVSFRAINIPQFSLFWILMLYDHMKYKSDKAMLRQYIGTADGILDHFDRLINQDGLVGTFDAECWAFVDWNKAWPGNPAQGIRTMAVPPIYQRSGVAAYNSLVYAWALHHAAAICTFIGRNDTATEYNSRADSLNKAVVQHCWSGEFFVDGPGATEICEHTQIFAILSGAVSGEEAVSLMERTMKHDSIPRCSYAMKHYVFRALEMTGLYSQYFEQMMQPWYKMIEDNLTTCAEDDVNFRSDCHGWSASPIYEMFAMLYGIKPDENNFGTLTEPRFSNLIRGANEVGGSSTAEQTTVTRARRQSA